MIEPIKNTTEVIAGWPPGNNMSYIYNILQTFQYCIVINA